MQSLQHILPKRFPSTATASATVIISPKILLHRHFSLSKKKPSAPAASADDDWNDAWESAWLPNDSSTTTTPPWENAATATAATSSVAAANDDSIDADTKAFVAEMDDRWSERRAAKKQQQQQTNRQPEQQQKNTSNNNDDKDVYRLRKQRIHAGLWMKEIDKLEESRLGGGPASADDIDRLLDSCSEIFDSGNIDMNDLKTPSTSDLKTKPDGWETTLKTQDGTIWDISQREEDILLQEFERRIAFSKFQIASFIKSHIFSRRRPVDGWKYMIEELGPNARRGKGSVQRLPSLADPSTQPFKEEKPSIAPNASSFRRR